jgi:hypothetical protein
LVLSDVEVLVSAMFVHVEPDARTSLLLVMNGSMRSDEIER